jgi:hypothetical protein
MKAYRRREGETPRILGLSFSLRLSYSWLGSPHIQWIGSWVDTRVGKGTDITKVRILAEKRTTSRSGCIWHIKARVGPINKSSRVASGNALDACFEYILTFVPKLTDSKKQAFLWETNSNSASQEIPSFYGVRSFITVFTTARTFLFKVTKRIKLSL